MNKVRFHWIYPIPIDIDTDKEVDVYIDKIVLNHVPEGHVRIVILQEPYNHGATRVIQANPQAYTFVLTYFDEILQTNPKARFFMGTTSWVQGYESPHKTFSVSTLVGGKVNGAMPGYKLRHDLWRSQHLILTPKAFYLSGELRWNEVSYKGQLALEGSIVPLSKAPLFDSQFHIAIENISIKNMFTEKLIDCFQTKTIPIYYGAPNIGDFFNIDGILVAKDLNDIIEISNSLTSDQYERMAPAMEDNYARSHKYCVYNDQVKEAILKLI
jgi:hypothetical protein